MPAAAVQPRRQKSAASKAFSSLRRLLPSGSGCAPAPMMNRSCGATILCNFAVYLFIWSRGVALVFPPGFFTPDARMPTTTPPQNPKEESSPRQDPPPLTTDFEQSTTTGKAHSKAQPLRKRALVACQAPERSPKRPSAARTGPGRFCGSEQIWPT